MWFSFFYCNLGPRLASVDVYINRQNTVCYGFCGLRPCNQGVPCLFSFYCSGVYSFPASDVAGLPSQTLFSLNIFLCFSNSEHIRWSPTSGSHKKQEGCGTKTVYGLPFQSEQLRSCYAGGERCTVLELAARVMVGGLLDNAFELFSYSFFSLRTWFQQCSCEITAPTMLVCEKISRLIRTQKKRFTGDCFKYKMACNRGIVNILKMQSIKFLPFSS